METIQEEFTAEERHERVITFLKRHIADKRRFELELIEKAKAPQSAHEHNDRTMAPNE